MVLTALQYSARAAGGSNYTIFGIGDLRLAGDARSNALGYTGVGVADGLSLNVNAPATWSRITETRLDASLLHESFRSTDGNKTLTLSITNFSGAALAVPVSQRFGITIVGSMKPYSNKDYDVFTSGSQQGMDYVVNHEGNGGLGRAQIGVSLSPFPLIAAGASFNYIFGSLENSRTLLPTTFGYEGGKTTGRTSTNAISGTIGVLVRGAGTPFALLKPFSVGAVLTTKSYLKAEGEFLFEFPAEADTVDVTVSDIPLPVAVGVGASCQLGERWLIAADMFAQAWGSVTLAVPTRDAVLYGIGIERSPAREPGATFWDRLAIRIGSYYHQTYYVVNGEGIDEWGVTGGFGIPFSGENRLNVSVEYGGRGKTGNNLIREDIFRLTFGLSLSELWFQSFDDEL
jgi:hypothetical protein